MLPTLIPNLLLNKRKTHTSMIRHFPRRFKTNSEALLTTPAMSISRRALATPVLWVNLTLPIWTTFLESFFFC